MGGFTHGGQGSGYNCVPLSLTSGCSSFQFRSHQLIVEKLTGKLKRRSTSFLPSEINDFDKAKENGAKFYIAAKFLKSQVPEKFTVGDEKTYNGFYNAPLEPDSKYKVYLRGVSSSPDGVRIVSMWWSCNLCYTFTARTFVSAR